jgi:hypothetical protein
MEELCALKAWRVLRKVWHHESSKWKYADTTGRVWFVYAAAKGYADDVTRLTGDKHVVKRADFTPQTIHTTPDALVKALHDYRVSEYGDATPNTDQ